jgi:hypothetical protein
MDIIARPTESPPAAHAQDDRGAVSARPETRPRRWAWPRMHHLLFVAFTLVAGVPIGVLAIWEGQTAFQNELDSVRERHLLVARNLTSTMSRYVKDLKSAFPMAFAGGAMAQANAGLVNLLSSLDVIHICVLNRDGSVDSVFSGLTDDVLMESPPDPERFKALRALADNTPNEPVLSKLFHDAANRPVFYLVTALPDGWDWASSARDTWCRCNRRSRSATAAMRSSPTAVAR